MPAIGSDSPRNDAGSVGAISPQLGTSSGSASRGTPNSAHSSSDQSPVSRSKQQRAAGVGDVGDVAGAAGHPGDQVGVDGADGVAARLHQRPRVRLVLGQPHQLGAGEVRVQPQPGQLGDPLLVARRRAAASQMSAVRRSCQTIARRGEPSVSRSHSTMVSRWLVMPTAVSSAASTLASASRGRLERGLPDLLRRVLDPAGLREVLGGTPGSPRPRSRPSRSTTTAVTPVVPASMARTLTRGPTVVADDLEDPSSIQLSRRGRPASRSSPCRPRRAKSRYPSGLSQLVELVARAHR